MTTGWLGWWASDVRVQSLVESQAVDEVSVYYWNFEGPDRPLCVYDNIDGDNDGQWGDCLVGTDTPWTTKRFERQRDAMQSVGIRVLGTLTHWSRSAAPSGGGFDDTLYNYMASAPAEFAEKVTDYTLKAGLDGVDIYFEVHSSLDDTWVYPVEDTGQWSEGAKVWQTFIRHLSEQLRAQGLLLSVSVPVARNTMTSTGTPIPSGGLPVYSWKDISPWVDRLKMVMDSYSFRSPGPVSPANWADQIAGSAVREIGRSQAQKVWLGTPQYGRNWPVTSSAGYVPSSDCPAGWQPSPEPVATVVTPRTVREIATENAVDPIWDSAAGEWNFSYWSPTSGRAQGQTIECSIQRTVWFSDTRSALGRASMATKYGFGGIAVWELGSLDADFLPEMKTYAFEASQPKISLTAPSRTVKGRPITLAAQFQSSGMALGTRQATLWWSPTRSAKRMSVASKLTGPDGDVAFRATPKASGFWWITASSRHGFVWTAGPKRIALSK